MANEYFTVEILPLINATTYAGTWIDISDYTLQSGIGAIYQQIDTIYEFDTGIYRYGSLYLGCTNKDGYFNEGGALFTYKRNRALVRVYFYNRDGDQVLTFTGLLNEAGTNFGINNKHVSLLFTSLDSIFDQVQIPAGTISDLDTFENAIKAILNQSGVTLVLGYDADKINVDLDLAIDDGGFFNLISVKNGLNWLLQASNSILTIDATGDIVVSSRAASANLVTFYGADDPFGRDDIIQIYNFNLGYHRCFNSIILNERETKDSTSISTYGLRQKPIDFDFMTDTGKVDTIAAQILAEYKDPKREVIIKIKIDRLADINLLDKINLVLEADRYNTINIAPTDYFKIISITAYPSNFTADIKLREV